MRRVVLAAGLTDPIPAPAPARELVHDRRAVFPAARPVVAVDQRQEQAGRELFPPVEAFRLVAGTARGSVGGGRGARRSRTLDRLADRIAPCPRTLGLP